MDNREIWLANVRFEETAGSKTRPVVIIDNQIFVITCLKMTSHAPRFGEYSLVHWEKAGLHKPTTVRVSKVLSLNPSDFIHKIGKLHAVDISSIQRLLEKN